MWYRDFGYFAVPIVIDDRNCLIDGYTSYLVARENDKKYVKVTRV